jgi:hypothetical protein
MSRKKNKSKIESQDKQSSKYEEDGGKVDLNSFSLKDGKKD